MTSVSRALPATPFAHDDGAADPRVEAALAAFDRGEGGPADVLAALATARLLVPVVAVAGAVEDGPEKAVEKNVEMAMVSAVGRDGRRGMLAFTSVEAMRRWNPAARPSPALTRAAAEAALADGAGALVIDIAGPVKFAVDADGLRSLAAGWRPLGRWPGLAETPSGPSAAMQPGARTHRPRWRRAAARVRRRLVSG